MEYLNTLQDELFPLLPELSLTSDAVDWSKLAQLCCLWLQFGRSMNLTGARDLVSLMPQIAEGLHVVALLKQVNLSDSKTFGLDVGSGAGFPALVILSALDLAMTMIEPRENRATFLQLALATIQAKDCHVIRGRLETNTWQALESSTPTPNFRQFSFAGARAVFPVQTWLQTASSWLSPQAICICHMKPGDPQPPGYIPVATVTSALWSIRAYRL